MLKVPAQPDALMAWMSSLADPTRLRLMRLLERHELGVVEACDVLQLPQSTVSRHLKVLSDEGWVRSTRQGTTHLYRMTLDELEAPARRLWILAREQIEQWPAIAQDELRLARRLRERENGTQAFFAGAAGQWDKLRSELYGDDFSRQAMLALLPPHYVVADLGCGTGQIAAELAENVQRVIGVDSSPAMLKAAQRRAAHLDNVELRRGELTAVPIDDAACDAALMILVVTYLPSPSTALKEAARVLKPAGRLIVVDLLPHDRLDFTRQMEQQHPGFAPDHVTRMLNEAGLASVSVRALPPAQNAKGPALFLAAAQKPAS